MLMWEEYHDRAMSSIDNLIQDFPEEISMLLLKATCLKEIGDSINAKELLEDASPENNPEVAIALSKMYQEESNLESAIEIIHSAYCNYPSNTSLIYHYSSLLTEAGRNKEGLYLLNHLTTNNSDKIEYWGYLSNCCLMLDLFDTAMVACKKANELAEDKQAWLLCNVGNMLNNKNLFSDAIFWLNKGLAIDTSSEYAHDRLAKAIKSKEEEKKKFDNYCKEGKKMLRDFKPVQTLVSELEQSVKEIEMLPA
jgi:predicted Zn-dependent protease